MGSLKNKVLNQNNDGQKHELTDQEFQYLKAMNDARQRIYGEQGQTISAFLYYVAGSRLGYADSKELQFEMDFDDPKHELKITPINLESESLGG